MTAAALVLYLADLAVAFGMRTSVHAPHTANSGFNGISGSPGSPPWWAGILFVLALVLGVTAPASALAGVVRPAPAGMVADAIAVAGLPTPPRLVTRRVTAPARVPAGHRPFPRRSTLSQLRNSGEGTVRGRHHRARTSLKQHLSTAEVRDPR